jgi:hypothetical protein
MDYEQKKGLEGYKDTVQYLGFVFESYKIIRTEIDKKKNCADFFLFHIPRQYLNKFLSLIIMHVNKLKYKLNKF